VPVERVADPQLSIGVPNGSPLRVTTRSRGRCASCRRLGPASFDVDRRRSPLTVAARDAGEVAYAARPHHRGTFSFG